jgi:ABC-type nitrate/sulfonate/bicarbonate transport system substrate-binding protein
VVRKDSGIKGLEDLKGKIIAVHRLGTTLDLTLRIGLKQNGIDPSTDVTITQVKVTNMPQVLLKGEVDAAFIFPMAYPQLVEDVDVILTPGDVFPKGAPFGMVIFTEEFIGKYPDEVRKFVKAYLKGLKWAMENPDKVPEIAAKDTGLSRDITEKIPWPAFNPSGRVADESFALMIEAIKEYDPESLGKEVAVRDFVDYQFIPAEVE